MQAYFKIDPLELHVSSEAFELREGAGAAIAGLASMKRPANITS